MNIPLDIHTHHLPQVPGSAIVNCLPDTFCPQPGGCYSVGIHPWQAGTDTTTAESLLCLALHPQVLAVGEAGLDKLAAAPLEMQLEVFRRQALLAMEADKPLIIHLVKATAQLLELKRGLRPANPWIIHGFRGKAALAAEYLRHGFYLSFGERYQDEALRTVPPHRLFLETDESTLPLEELYRRAAAVRGVTPHELRLTVGKNVARVFFRQDGN